MNGNHATHVLVISKRISMVTQCTEEVLKNTKDNINQYW